MATLVEGNLGHIEETLIQVWVAESFSYATVNVLLKLQYKLQHIFSFHKLWLSYYFMVLLTFFWMGSTSVDVMMYTFLSLNRFPVNPKIMITSGNSCHISLPTIYAIQFLFEQSITKLCFVSSLSLLFYLFLVKKLF